MDKLTLLNIHKDYEDAPLLKGINLEVKSGEILCLLGRSGSGKSTLLRIVAGLETQEMGNVFWNESNLKGVPTYQRNFGLMFQDYALFPHRSVAENVAFGLEMRKLPSEAIKKSVETLLERVNLTNFATRRIEELSGGEKQRVALARALAPNPRLMMLDEPLAALDRSLREELQDELRSVLHQAGIPVIYVTHDQEEAVILGDRIGILNDGMIEQVDSPENIYQKPVNRWVAEFFGITNIIEGVVSSISPLRVETSLGTFQPGVVNESPLPMDTRVNLLLKPDWATIASRKQAFNQIHGVIRSCQFRGDGYRIQISNHSTQNLEFFLAEPITVGTEVTLTIHGLSIVCLRNK
jgi:ABC-type Fe3+/spermidine/putrescine transport system ATPase subunit